MSKITDPTTGLIDALLTYLQDTVQVGVIGTDLFKYVLRETPDKAIAVLPLGGTVFPGDLGGVQRADFQIVVRDTTVTKALQTTEKIFFALDRAANIFPGRYGRILISHEPGVYVFDSNKRAVSTLNGSVVFSRFGT